MSAAGPSVLAVPDRKESGRFPVRHRDGRPAAHVSVKWTGTAFTATDADDEPLCAAAVGWGGLSSTWKATGPDGRPLLSVKKSWAGTRADVTLARGGTFVLRGSAWRRDFTVTDAQGATVLSAVPQTSALSFHPFHYAVEQARPVFDLAEVVALVQIWRLVKKQESAVAAAGAAGAIGATGA